LIDLPATLIRFFVQEEHARQFIAGQIRFGLLEFYRTTESPRQDQSEGKVSFEWDVRAPQIVVDRETRRVIARRESNRNIHYTGVSFNRHYILSTSRSEVDRLLLAERFGRFIVIIKKPAILLSRIKASWAGDSRALPDSAFVAPVAYDKDGLLRADPYLIAPPHLSYSQKPKPYSDEIEFRYILECKVDAERAWEDHLTLLLPDCNDICSLEVLAANAESLTPQRVSVI
jgi:hypothetical protein